MGNKKGQNYIKIDNKTVSSLNRTKRHKRALAIYVYSVYAMTGELPISTSLATVLDVMGLKLSTSNKRSVIDSLTLLSDLGLAEFFTSIRMNEHVDLDNLKDSKLTIWIKPLMSDSEVHYTLIPISSLETVLSSNIEENVDDLVLALTYVCRRIERRKHISPVMWTGINTIESEIHIDGKRFNRISRALRDMKVIYFDIVEFDSGAKNYIYSLYEDREHVDSAIAIAKRNGTIDKRVKLPMYNNDSENAIEIEEDGDFAVDMRLSKLFEVHGIVCNDGVMSETNRYSDKHGVRNLVNLIGEYNHQILSADNKIGAYRSLLRRNY